MQRIKPIKLDGAQGKAKELLEVVKKAMGKEVAMFSSMANSPAALEGYLNFSGALSKGALTPKLREQVALTTAGRNGCNYCASAHTFLGERVGINKEELSSNLEGSASDGATQAALKFVTQLVEKRGKVDESDLNAVRKAGFSDEEIVEIVAHVALNIFTNYFNETFKTEIDFPKVEAIHSCSTNKQECCNA